MLQSLNRHPEDVDNLELNSTTQHYSQWLCIYCVGCTPRPIGEVVLAGIEQMCKITSVLCHCI